MVIVMGSGMASSAMMSPLPPFAAILLSWSFVTCLARALSVATRFGANAQFMNWRSLVWTWPSSIWRLPARHHFRQQLVGVIRPGMTAVADQPAHP